MTTRLKILAVSLTLILTLHAQKEDVIWYFGGSYSLTTWPGAGLDFNSGSPVTLTNSAMGYTEGSAIQCDKFGNLLFYTNGATVWDRTHAVMQNGTNLGGDISSMQSSLIIPLPNDSTKYYLFANAGYPTSNGVGLFYSEIDMMLNAGLGSVTSVKQVSMITQNSEWLAGNWHANGTDYWVVASDFDSCNFYSYHVSSSGIASPIITPLLPNNSALLNTIEFNNKGDKLTFVVGIGWMPEGYRMIADFDKNTGVISNPVFLDTVSNQSACFSPDDNLLYYFRFVPPGAEALYQCNMNASNIPASKQVIATYTTGYHSAMKLGPDKKIYCTDIDKTTLDVIQFPNQQGASCSFVKNVISLTGRISGRLLPNKTYSQKLNPNNVQEFKLENNVSIYPNPFSTSLSIKSKIQIDSYKLYDSFGNLIKQESLSSYAIDYNICLYVKEGIYFLILYDKKGNCCKKILTRL